MLGRQGSGLSPWHAQNIVKKSKGFNWGPSAVSTTYWTGVRLCDLLRFCGVKKPSQGAKHVVFAGIDGELPQVLALHAHESWFGGSSSIFYCGWQSTSQKMQPGLEAQSPVGVEAVLMSNPGVCTHSCRARPGCQRIAVQHSCSGCWGVAGSLCPTSRPAF